MARYQNDSLRFLAAVAPQHGINVHDFRWLGHPIRWGFDEGVGFHLKASAAGLRVAFQFAADPLARRHNAFARVLGLVPRG